MHADLQLSLIFYVPSDIMSAGHQKLFTQNQSYISHTYLSRYPAALGGSLQSV